MAYFAAVIGQSACFGRRDAADNSLVSRRSRGRIANLRSISPSEKNQIRGNPHNRICKKIALQQPKTGKFDYLSEPNHPAHSMAFKFFTDDSFQRSELSRCTSTLGVIAARATGLVVQTVMPQPSATS